MKNFKKVFIIFLLFFIYFLCCTFSFVSSYSQDISNSLVRLHVIANSDSDEDQALKYKVRNALIEYMNTKCSNCISKTEALNVINCELDNFKTIAQNTIYENGFDYLVSVELGSFEFPTKNYGDISLPAGVYDALKVKIGNASGQNWWCVMFPPLCFTDISSGSIPEDSKNYLKENLSNDEYSIISNGNNSNIQLKFKLLELFNKY